MINCIPVLFSSLNGTFASLVADVQYCNTGRLFFYLISLHITVKLK